MKVKNCVYFFFLLPLRCLKTDNKMGIKTLFHFDFSKDLYESISDLDDEVRHELYDKITAFVFEGIEPISDNPTVAAVLDGIVDDLRRQVESEYMRQRRAENGRKGGLSPCRDGKRRGARQGNQNARKKTTAAPVPEKTQSKPAAMHIETETTQPSGTLPTSDFDSTKFLSLYNVAVKHGTNPDFKPIKTLSAAQQKNLINLSAKWGINGVFSGIYSAVRGESTPINFDFLKS